MRFLRNKYAKLLTAILLVQAGVYYAVAQRSELIPAAGPLALFPSNISTWKQFREYPIEPEIATLLNADDIISRDYVNSATATGANLFIAYFKTQRYGQSPHSPKNCLPGAGWESMENTTISIDVPQWKIPIIANKYLVAKGEDKMLAIYWYQSRNRVVASEYAARFWLVLDSIRYHRSDTSIVRVTVPVIGNDIEGAKKTAVTFIQAMFPTLLLQLPS